MICKICNIEVQSIQSHITQKHKNFNINEYYDIYYKKLHEDLCIICKNKTSFKNFSLGYNRLCNKHINNKIKCKLCNKEVIHMGNHLMYSHPQYTYKSYYDNFYKLLDENLCINCKQPTEFISIKNGYIKLCNNCNTLKNNPKTILCKICNTKHPLLGMSSHIKKHDLTTKEYYDKYIKKEDEGYCIICNKPTNYHGLLYGYGKVCSKQCQYEYQKTEEYASICNNTNQIRYGTNYPSQNDKVQNKLKENNIKKYGVPCNLNFESVKQKANKSTSSNKARQKRKNRIERNKKLNGQLNEENL